MNWSPKFSTAISVLAVMLGASPAHAGMPVIDMANLVQSIQNVLDQLHSLENEADQIDLAERQLQSINGVRGLANMANNPLLHDYIPAAAPRILRDVDSLGTSGLAGTGKVLRDAQMIYDCENVPAGPQQVQCQAQLGLPYQQKGFFVDASEAASRRMDQINDLMRQAAATQDPKAAQEIQARIAGEAAMLAHEGTQIQLQAAQAQAEDRVNASQAGQAMKEMSTRTGNIANFMHP